MAVVDEQIYYSLGGFVNCLINFLSCLVVASLAVPLIIVVILLVSFFCTWLFVYGMKAYRDCFRIESVTMSPILSYFQETFSGNSTIRAFGRETDFKDKSFTLVNKTTNANQVTIGVFGWCLVRLDMMIIIVVAAGCTSCILLRDSANPIYLSLMLQYLMTM